MLIRRARLLPSVQCGCRLRRKLLLTWLIKFSRALHLVVQKRSRLLRCVAFLLLRWICSSTTRSSSAAWKIASSFQTKRIASFLHLTLNVYPPAASSLAGRATGNGYRRRRCPAVSGAIGSLETLGADSRMSRVTNSLFMSSSNEESKEYFRFKEAAGKAMVKPYQHPGMHSYQTALCIVPIEEIWDTIQKARHVTGDETIYVWPPSIRLFHPFVPPSLLSQAALDTASMVVEKYHIKPFQVVLDSFVIIPYYVLDSENRLITGRDQHKENNAALSCGAASTGKKKPTHDSAQALAAREELYGKENFRNEQFPKTVNSTISSETCGDNKYTSNLATTTKRNIPRKRGRPPKQPLEEEDNFLSTMDDSTIQSSRYYDGPCFLCLQPSPASRAKLQKLRNALKKELFSHYNAFAAAASTTARIQTFPASTVEKRPKPPPFRPLITLGRFQTVLQANRALNRLKSFWNPLTFNVTDLHFVSQAASADVPGVFDGMPYLSKEAHLRDPSKQQYECDSLVSLIGEEPVSNALDDHEEDFLFNIMCQEGITDKGTVINLDNLFQAKAEEAKLEAREMMMEECENNQSLEQLLEILPEEEEDWNEGGTIVIGRTQFFLGQMREYVGMPAVNPIESKDRVMRKGVSGAAQRKPVAH